MHRVEQGNDGLVSKSQAGKLQKYKLIIVTKGKGTLVAEMWNQYVGSV